jgi:hypothetical protein
LINYCSDSEYGAIIGLCGTAALHCSRVRRFLLIMEGPSIEEIMASEAARSRRLYPKRPPPPSPAQEPVPQQEPKPQTILKLASWTLSGRMDCRSDISKLAHIHEAFPLLVQKVEGSEGTRGCPALMWQRMDSQTFETFEALDDDHVAANKDDDDDATGSFVLKGISPVLNVAL